mmetsp:Transcript_4052/g.16257  ORF Transcript_4052/g.16257 Transcript_4052/m.16257 type:complete len:302 (-) Transcript_4052:474-1379(-)
MAALRRRTASRLLCVVTVWSSSRVVAAVVTTEPPRNLKSSEPSRPASKRRASSLAWGVVVAPTVARGKGGSSRPLPSAWSSGVGRRRGRQAGVAHLGGGARLHNNFWDRAPALTRRPLAPGDGSTDVPKRMGDAITLSSLSLYQQGVAAFAASGSPSHDRRAAMNETIHVVVVVASDAFFCPERETHQKQTKRAGRGRRPRRSTSARRRFADVVSRSASSRARSSSNWCAPRRARAKFPSPSRPRRSLCWRTSLWSTGSPRSARNTASSRARSRLPSAARPSTRPLPFSRSSRGGSSTRRA